VDDDGVVSCEGSIELTSSITELPVKFGRVSNNFKLETGRLNTLEGCPTYVGNTFTSTNNPIKDLTGAPQRVGGLVMINHSQITNLKGCPKTKHLYLANNPLTSLEGLPKRLQLVTVSYDPHLPLLRTLTAQEIDILSAYPMSSQPMEKIRDCKRILEKYASTTNPADILRCASELNEHGLEGNAEW
jgi:hypothetical protein